MAINILRLIKSSPSGSKTSEPETKRPLQQRKRNASGDEGRPPLLLSNIVTGDIFWGARWGVKPLAVITCTHWWIEEQNPNPIFLNEGLHFLSKHAMGCGSEGTVTIKGIAPPLRLDEIMSCVTLHHTYLTTSLFSQSKKWVSECVGGRGGERYQRVF